MNLWIRSQDKKMLLKIETIEVVNNWFQVNSKYNIGFYKTNERALEVLDEIQNFIERKDIEGNRYYEGEIYEMPKE